MGGFALTLASKLNIALSRMGSSCANTEEGAGGVEEEDVSDLIAILEELNQHKDLTVKLNNQSKLCKILQQSPDIRVIASDSSLN